MNSRERLLTVLDGGIPDRVPSFELLIDANFRREVCPGLDFYAAQEALGFDLILFGLGSSEEPVQWIDREKKIFRDKWGVLNQFTTETMPVAIGEPLIQTAADLASYHPPDPAHPAILRQTREVVERFKGRMAIGYLGEASFAPQQYLRGGLQNLLLDYAEGSDLPKMIQEVVVDYHCKLYQNVIREGVEVIVLGDDYAGKTGPFMSPEHFREYVYPGFRQVVETCKEAGAYVIKHADGDLWPLLDMIVGTGIDALGPLEPLPTMQLSKIKAAYPEITVVGNVDVDLLSVGTVAKVREATRACLADAAPGGRFILSSGNSITSTVKPDLYQALIDVKNEYGRYPMVEC
jgi:uroporphyrinogen decarboxylase